MKVPAISSLNSAHAKTLTSLIYDARPNGDKGRRLLTNIPEVGLANEHRSEPGGGLKTGKQKKNKHKKMKKTGKEKAIQTNKKIRKKKTPKNTKKNKQRIKKASGNRKYSENTQEEKHKKEKENNKEGTK